MRIIAGTARGRPLLGPKDDGIRPTSDRVRETVFNVLGQWMDGLTVLDLYAGTGALAFEALCDEAAILHRGRLLFLGSLEELLRRGEDLPGRGAGLGDIFVELVGREEAEPGGGADGGERSGKEAGG